jgi:hypothetical protein
MFMFSPKGQKACHTAQGFPDVRVPRGLPAFLLKPKRLPRAVFYFSGALKNNATPDKGAKF